MRLFPILLLLFAFLAVCFAAETQPEKSKPRKTLRMVKALKKSTIKKNETQEEQDKSESYHVPILVSAPSRHHIPPVSVEVRDDIHSATDYHPIQPIHLLTHPDRDHYGDGQEHREYVYQGPVAVPYDYPYGRDKQSTGDYEIHNRVSPGEYYSESYGDLSAIPGIPGQDYPTYIDMPKTGFKCMEHTSTPGFYADVETQCQMWHYCQPDGRHDRFLCPNGTIFDQMTRVCNWWFNVHCDSSLSHYDVNFDLYREPLRISSHHQDNSIAPPPLRISSSHHSQDNAIAPPPLKISSSHYAQDHSIAPPPNSFLSHLENFEARSDYNPPIQSAASQPVHRYPVKMAPSPQVRHESDTPIDYDSSNAHTLSTPISRNSGHSHARPTPIVLYDSSRTKATPTILDSSHPRSKLSNVLYSGHDQHRATPMTYVSDHAHSIAKPSEQKLQEVDKYQLPLKKRKRISRKKLRKHQGLKKDMKDDDIPTYREAKATPAARRYRIVRRRKMNKSQ